MKLLAVRLLLFCYFGTSHADLEQSCVVSSQQHRQFISGEITGKNTFIHSVAGKWQFMLEPSSYGWNIRLRDKEGIDLSQITPPYDTSPNPRELFGWHFRNAANTGKNTGDIKSPQHVQLFEFSPSLSGTGGFKPPRHSTNVQQKPNFENGQGSFTITQMELVDLLQGQKARINYLRFHVCLTWPKSAQ